VIPSLNAIVGQLKNCPFAAFTVTELKIITAASDSNGASPRVFQLKSMPVLSDAIVTFFSSIVVLSPNCRFWFVPLLHSVSDMFKHVILSRFGVHTLSSIIRENLTL
jgi:hypothetical protein